MPASIQMQTMMDNRSGKAGAPLDGDMAGNKSTGSLSTGLNTTAITDNNSVSTYTYIGGGSSNASGVSTPLAPGANVGLGVAMPVNGPACTVAPAVTGTASVGSTLTTTTGTWTGVPAPTTTIQWYAAGSPIPGATATTLVLTAAQQGKTIYVVVTGTNTLGTLPAKSNTTAAVS